MSHDVHEKPWLVVFYSAASGPCRRAEGFLAQVLQRNANHDTFRIFRVEHDRDAEAFAKFAVDVVPTLVVVEDKIVRGRLEHPRGCRQIETFLRPWLRRSAPAERAGEDHEGELASSR